jgi:hypothetical protein
MHWPDAFDKIGPPTEGGFVKTLLRIIGAILILAVVTLVILRITGLNPNGRRAGLWLTGNLVTGPVSDWSFTDQVQVVELETHPWYLIPHSVTIFCVNHNGHLYLSSIVAPGVPSYPHSRRWNEAVAHDPHVRIKIGNNLYDRTLTYVTDPVEEAGEVQAEKKKYFDYKMPDGATFNVFRVSDD